MAPLPPVIIGTAGHVDHGKTELIRALTGIETDRLHVMHQRSQPQAAGMDSNAAQGQDNLPQKAGQFNGNPRTGSCIATQCLDPVHQRQAPR